MAKSSDNIVPFRRAPPPGGSRPKGWRPPAWIVRILTRTVAGWLILVNVAIWIAMVAWSLGAGIFTPFPDWLVLRAGELVPSLILRQPWRLVTSAFLHANLLHVGLNMAFLAWVGPKLEKAYGKGRFALVYAIALLGGALASWGWHSYTGGYSVGASGAIMGVMGALFGLAYRAEGWNSQLTRFWGMNSLFIVGGTMFFGMISSEGPIDNACHVGGWIAGAAAGYAFAGKPAIAKTIERALLAGFGVLVAACFAISLATPISAYAVPTAAARVDDPARVLIDRAEDRIALHHDEDARADLRKAFANGIHDPEDLRALALDAEKAGDRNLAHRAAMTAVFTDPSDTAMKNLLDRLARETPAPAASPK